MSGSRFAPDTRIATIAMAFVIAIASMPILSGWVVADSHCVITMDICHPAQSIDISHAPLFGPAPVLSSKIDVSPDVVIAIDDAYSAIAGRLGEAPDPPPPKALV